MKNPEKFHKWLIDVKGFKVKSANDVISRLNRVKKIIGNADIESPRGLSRLLKSDQFTSASLYVKSQLKRAVTLYKESKS